MFQMARIAGDAIAWPFVKSGHAMKTAAGVVVAHSHPNYINGPVSVGAAWYGRRVAFVFLPEMLRLGCVAVAKIKHGEYWGYYVGSFVWAPAIVPEVTYYTSFAVGVLAGYTVLITTNMLFHYVFGVVPPPAPSLQKERKVEEQKESRSVEVVVQKTLSVPETPTKL